MFGFVHVRVSVGMFVCLLVCLCYFFFLGLYVCLLLFMVVMVCTFVGVFDGAVFSVRLRMCLCASLSVFLWASSLACVWVYVFGRI